jgi:hypothetical protein
MQNNCASYGACWKNQNIKKKKPNLSFYFVFVVLSLLLYKFFSSFWFWVFLQLRSFSFYYFVFSVYPTIYFRNFSLFFFRMFEKMKKSEINAPMLSVHFFSFKSSCKMQKGVFKKKKKKCQIKIITTT